MRLHKYVDLTLQHVLVKLVHNLASFTVYYVLYVHSRDRERKWLVKTEKKSI